MHHGVFVHGVADSWGRTLISHNNDFSKFSPICGEYFGQKEC